MTIAKSAAGHLPDEPFGHFAPSALQAVIIALVRHTFLRRGDFRRHFVGLLYSLRPTPIDAGFRGGRYRLHYQDNLAECGLLLSPNYNSADIEFLLAGTPVGGVFLDVGANVGLYTIPLALKVGPSGRAVAVEPGVVALSKRYCALSTRANWAISERSRHISVRWWRSSTPRIRRIRSTASLSPSRQPSA